MSNGIYPIRMKWKNFKSYGNRLTELELPKPGENMLIQGEIGSGKSALAEILIYNLTGKKIGSNSLVNSINKKGMYTQVEWYVPGLSELLTIERGQKPAMFKIKGIPGTIQKELNIELEKRIPLTDPQLLLNLCVLSSSKSLPFFSLKKQERLNFLRNFVDTTQLDKLSEEAKNINLQVNKSKNILEGEVSTIRSQAEDISSTLANRQTVDPTTIKTLSDEARLLLEGVLDQNKELESVIVFDQDVANGLSPKGDRLDVDISSLYFTPEQQTDIKKQIDDKEVEIQEVENDLSDINSIVSDIEGRIRSMKQSIDAATNDAKDITSESCLSYFNELIEGYKANQSNMEEDLTQLKKHRKPIVEIKAGKVDEQNELGSKLTRNKQKIQTTLGKVREEIDSILQQLRKDDAGRQLKAKVESEADANADLHTLLEDTKIKLGKKKLALAEASRLFLVSKEYRGILDGTWAFMANRMIPYLNSRIPHYMEELELDFTMTLDPRDLTKPIFRGRPGVGDLKLEDLSTGQKGVLSFCLAHSLRDLNAHVAEVSTDFLVLDEIASNLDVDMVDTLMNFETRSMRAHNTSLILITHDVALQQREWDHIIKVSRNNFSELDVVNV